MVHSQFLSSYTFEVAKGSQVAMTETFSKKTTFGPYLATDESDGVFLVSMWIA